LIPVNALAPSNVRIVAYTEVIQKMTFWTSEAMDRSKHQNTTADYCFLNDNVLIAT
jgi:hypothetical protein